MYYQRLRTAAALVAIALHVAVAQTVKTVNGTIQGAKCGSSNANSFLAIPYAKPPIGDLRFAPPQSYNQSYSNTLQATTAAPSCIQFGTDSSAKSSPQAEDCLFLNVWTPENATPASKLPVKFWIYGGSNTEGSISEPTYNGCFAATDSIVVSVNYRVGPLGFLAISTLNLSGNYGIMDQLLGLQWVHENIGAFGGDPTKILVFGQSAGAMDTFVLATLPMAPKLMKAAAMESGGGRDYATVAHAQAWQSTFITALNCSSSNISCVRAATTSSLQQSVLAMPDTTYAAISATTLFEHQGAGPEWGPLIDGVFIAENPATAGVKVPSIFGSNTQDASLFIIPAFGANVFKLNESTYDGFLEENFGPLAAKVNATFPLSNYSSLGRGAYPAILSGFTDYAYHCPAYRGLAGGVKNNVPVWTYSFNHTPSCAWYQSIPQNSGFLSALGPTHSAELPFVFNMTSNLPAPNGNCTFTNSEKALALVMSAAWTSMAAYGIPADSSRWPTWDPTKGEGLNINDTLTIGVVDYNSCTSFWNGIADDISKLVANGTSGSNSTDTTTLATATSTSTSKPTGNAGAIMQAGWFYIAAVMGVGFAVGI